MIRYVHLLEIDILTKSTTSAISNAWAVMNNITYTGIPAGNVPVFENAEYLAAMIDSNAMITTA